MHLTPSFLLDWLSFIQNGAPFGWVRCRILYSYREHLKMSCPCQKAREGSVPLMSIQSVEKLSLLLKTTRIMSFFAWHRPMDPSVRRSEQNDLLCRRAALCRGCCCCMPGPPAATAYRTPAHIPPNLKSIFSPCICCLLCQVKIDQNVRLNQFTYSSLLLSLCRRILSCPHAIVFFCQFFYFAYSALTERRR